MAQTTTSSTKLPDYIEDPTKTSLKSIEDFLNSDANYVFGTKPGESLYTPLSGSQQESIGNVNWLADQDLASMFGISDAEGMWKDFANDGPAMVEGDYSGAQIDGMGRVVDEGGALGSIDDYMNPYLEGVLQPQIREIDEAVQRARNDLGSSSAMSGAFGDARHGIREAELDERAMQQVGDVTGSAYSNAFNNAMGMRQGDLARMLNVDLANQSSTNQGIGRNMQRDFANQGAEESATARKAAGAQGITDLGGRYFNLFGDVNDMLFNAGEVERDAEEERRQTMQAFQEALSGKKYDDALRLLMATQGTPYETTRTQNTESSADFGGLAGSIIGALF